MRLIGFEETSFIDWDDRISGVLFTGACNLNCPFCHNYRIAADDPALPTLEWAELAALLKKRKDWLSGIVVTGGEPMMHPEVFALFDRLKSFGFPLKLDTNGTFPYQVNSLITLGLVDYVAMDIKAPLNERYSMACGCPVDLAVIRRSVRLLMQSGVPYEFRTTLVPGLVDPEDIPEIGRAVEGARALYLQSYVPKSARADSYKEKKPYTLAEAESMAESLRPFVSSVKLRGRFL
ncbi:MAG: anaerobic ribonucleoside-triphosphate reductase activating protein [bacterium]